MKQARGALARADLLRSMAALELAGASAQAVQDMAQRLRFFPDLTAAQPALQEGVLSVLASAGDAAMPAQISALPPVLPQRASLPVLDVPLFDILHVSLLDKVQPSAQRQALRAEQYKPRQTEPLSFAPLLPTPKLARRMREALAQSHAGRALDVTRAVGMLAQGCTPARWPRLAWPHAPEQVTVLVDRTLHLRPYWHDQDQLVHTLAQWIGPNQMTTYTVQGDPWQSVACWARGRGRGWQPCPCPCKHPCKHLCRRAGTAAYLAGLRPAYGTGTGTRRAPVGAATGGRTGFGSAIVGLFNRARYWLRCLRLAC